MKFTALTLLSASLAALVSASTKPVGDTPSGNPINKPGLGDIVFKGQPYTIKWNPTSSGTVTLVLLRGPSSNILPLKSIADTIANSGSFSWTPDSSLETDTTHYGIQLIQDSNGAYQYSSQFGVGDASGSSGNSTGTPSNGTVSGGSYNTTCHACPPKNMTTTLSGTAYSQTSVSAQPTLSSNLTLYTTATPSATTEVTSTTSPPTTSAATATASSSSAKATNAAGRLALPLGSTVVGFAGMLVACLF